MLLIKNLNLLWKNCLFSQLFLFVIHLFILILITKIVAPDITAALKIKVYHGKNGFLASSTLMGNCLCLRSRHLVLWSLGTLTGQQRFYGSGLVT